MKRRMSEEFRQARRTMIQQRTKCHECEDFATELHHIIAVEDGGTDDKANLLPLCKKCHEEYTSEQTTKRNKMWITLNLDDSGGVTAQCKGDQHVTPLGTIHEGIKAEITGRDKLHYQYEWIVTVEIPATTAQESKEKLRRFKQELLNRYAVTDDVWLTGIRRWNG